MRLLGGSTDQNAILVLLGPDFKVRLPDITITPMGVELNGAIILRINREPKLLPQCSCDSLGLLQQLSANSLRGKRLQNIEVYQLRAMARAFRTSGTPSNARA